jgi:tRNA dimethylallyltransferase
MEYGKKPTTNYQLPTTPPLIVVAGETASGKSALALDLAERLSGEIICADSRTVYKGMDIGTAKPTSKERAQVLHHGLDVVEPGERFTAADFKQLALQAIEDISSRGKVPIMVGGTGLYVDTVLYDYQFSTPEQAAQRDPQNPRHLLKTAEPDSRSKLRDNTLLIGLSVERDILKQRIVSRVQQMIAQGLETEVRQLVDRYGWGSDALKGIGYREWEGYFNGSKSLDETVASIAKDTVDYAKRQRTWFKRNKSIQWISKQSKAVDFATTFLNKKQ